VVERLNLGFLIEGKHHCMSGRIDVKSNHIPEFLGEPLVVRQLVLPDAMRLPAQHGIHRGRRSWSRRLIASKIVGFSLSCIAVATTVWLAACAPAQASGSGLPADVIDFVGRRASCLEWTQKATDPKQTAQVDKIMHSLKCADIKGNEQALRSSYADNPSVIAALNATWIKTVRRIQVRPATGTLPSGPNH
jgi:hypothetical protein